MPFKFNRCDIEGLVIIEPTQFGDSRGFFMEEYKKSDFVNAGITEEFVQDNHSCSSKGVLRGLHYQIGDAAQGKLVRVLSGKVWDVVVDIRKDSKTFGKWFGVEISAENKKMFYIPAGFAHGFVTLEDDTHFLYKCTKEYAPNVDRGIFWKDLDINIEWPIDNLELIISDKDKKNPTLKEAEIK